MLKYVIATLAVFAAASSSFAAVGGEPAKDHGKKEGHEAGKKTAGNNDKVKAGEGHEAGKDHAKKEGHEAGKEGHGAGNKGK